MTSAERYIEHIRVEKRYSPRTCALYAEAIASFSTFAYPEKAAGDGPISDEEMFEVLTPITIRGWIASRMESGISARSVNLSLSALSSYCNFLVRRGAIASNPVSKVTRPKEKRMLPEFYTEGAVKELIVAEEEELLSPDESWSEMRDKMIVILLYATAMRRAELCNLKIANFDNSRGVFRIIGKGAKEREIPVNSLISNFISLYLKKLAEEISNPEGWFFLTDKGARLYPAFVNLKVKKMLEGEEGFTGRKSPHVFRHSLATHLLNNGAGLNSIKELLGHSSLAATQIYAHNTFEQMKNTYLTAHPRAKKGGTNGN